MQFKIYSPLHTIFAAYHLCSQIKKLNHTAEIVKTIDINDDSIYIIYNAANITQFPKKYIVYQTEIADTHWFTDQYLETIMNAISVWDYSKININKYKHLNNNIHYVTPGICPIRTPEKDIQVLFYGWIEGSPRRRKILDNIKKYIPVTEITDKTGVEMWRILERTKIVLNIHYYEHSPLETFRINEALSFNCQVVSENSKETAEYDSIISFGSTPIELAMKIHLKLSNIKTEYIEAKHLDNSIQLKYAINSI